MQSVIYRALLCIVAVFNVSIAHALEPDTADVHFSKYVDPITIKVNQGGSTGCPAGQRWDIYVGGCTPAVGIKTLTTSQSCSCTCPSGSTGSCTASQSGSYVVYGWRLPTNGAELVSYNGAVSWEACKETTNSCDGEGGGTKPPAGTQYTIETFICGSSHPSYSLGSLDASSKAFIIGTYRQFNAGGRCPEAGGFSYWQSSWANWAKEYQDLHPGASFDLALAATKYSPTADAMDKAARENGENDPAINTPILNAFCSADATQKYGVPLTAHYLSGSGSTCVVD